MMDGVSRALPCVAKRAIMGGGREARRGCSARGVGSPDVDRGVAWPEKEFIDGDWDAEEVREGACIRREGRDWVNRICGDCNRSGWGVASPLVSGIRVGDSVIKPEGACTSV